MEFSPTEEQTAAMRMAREFATNEVLPKAAEIDREHRHPTELVQRMAQLGQSTTLDHALALEQQSFGLLFSTADQREGMSAFLAKPRRAAQFKGQ